VFVESLNWFSLRHKGTKRFLIRVFVESWLRALVSFVRGLSGLNCFSQRHKGTKRFWLGYLLSHGFVPWWALSVPLLAL
jgi:hypothetical protein